MSEQSQRTSSSSHTPFALTASGDALRSDVPYSARPAVLMITDPVMWLPAGEMAHCVFEGTSAFPGVFGEPFFEYVARSPHSAALFHEGMAAVSDAENLPALAGCRLPRRGTVVDVGGGRGGFLLEVLRAAPGLSGVLFDEERVVTEHRLDVPETAGRWTIRAGDFFRSVPYGDVLVLKRVLHDWDDEQCVTILRNCRAALAPGGTVLVVESVVPPGNTPHQSKSLDLMMMPSLQGRERTQEEFAGLFERAGLRLRRVVPTDTVPSVIEAVAALDSASSPD